MGLWKKLMHLFRAAPGMKDDAKKLEEITVSKDSFAGQSCSMAHASHRTRKIFRSLLGWFRVCTLPCLQDEQTDIIEHEAADQLTRLSRQGPGILHNVVQQNVPLQDDRWSASLPHTAVHMTPRWELGDGLRELFEPLDGPTGAKGGAICVSEIHTRRIEASVGGLQQAIQHAPDTTPWAANIGPQSHMLLLDSYLTVQLSSVLGNLPEISFLTSSGEQLTGSDSTANPFSTLDGTFQESKQERRRSEWPGCASLIISTDAPAPCPSFIRPIMACPSPEATKETTGSMLVAEDLSQSLRWCLSSKGDEVRSTELETDSEGQEREQWYWGQVQAASECHLTQSPSEVTAADRGPLQLLRQYPARLKGTGIPNTGRAPRRAVSLKAILGVSQYVFLKVQRVDRGHPAIPLAPVCSLSLGCAVVGCSQGPTCVTSRYP
jgi:hypothetical protein